MNTNFIIKQRKTTEDTVFFTESTEISLRVLCAFSAFSVVKNNCVQSKESANYTNELINTKKVLRTFPLRLSASAVKTKEKPQRSRSFSQSSQRFSSVSSASSLRSLWLKKLADSQKESTNSHELGE